MSQYFTIDDFSPYAISTKISNECGPNIYAGNFMEDTILLELYACRIGKNN